MLIGAHVSPAGGPAKAVERGEALGARSIQIFNQNPRAWKPTIYDADQVAAYHEALDAGPVEALLIHAVYLLNAASEDAIHASAGMWAGKSNHAWTANAKQPSRQAARQGSSGRSGGGIPGAGLSPWRPGGP